jgi:hypothetical protein
MPGRAVSREGHYQPTIERSRLSPTRTSANHLHGGISMHFVETRWLYTVVKNSTSYELPVQYIYGIVIGEHTTDNPLTSEHLRIPFLMN